MSHDNLAVMIGMVIRSVIEMDIASGSRTAGVLKEGMYHHTRPTPERLAAVSDGVFAVSPYNQERRFP
jgi:hypothetical protein